jgi:ribosomal protein L15E
MLTLLLKIKRPTRGMHRRKVGFQKKQGKVFYRIHWPFLPQRIGVEAAKPHNI